jgi:LPPG:FO 2-phospho-L-lactate transferase
VQRGAGVPIIAVTPILSEFASRGPTVKIMKDLGVVPSPFAVIEHYRDLVDALVLDIRDETLLPLIEVPVRICNTLMSNPSDCERVTKEVLYQLYDLEAPARSTRERPGQCAALPTQGSIKRLA